ncbi:RING-H2 finger protein ATL70-like [Cynara cardunculus var. scolymus]|uniref:RING-type domain-containing protein n=1 Tax=Cynara cardunculus var. scolymus TaxID=59895 RepID=A0A103YIF9_CYNCS|nr:RING-H2 finger protein ATL70-like [Cynara cardunculus var. scolymus]KVI09622.1 hypothetical protein Ccrd_012020 [Cynara cardunculus var. scolymus]
MNATVDAGEPSYSTTGTSRGSIGYDLGFSFLVIFFIFTICYTSYLCKRRMSSQSPPPPTDSDSDDNRCMRALHQGFDDDVLSTFPTFLYSEAVNYGSGCSICLADYNPANVIRLMPKCGHLFHVKCIDKWLKVHPTCPVCRNSPLPTPPELT